MFLIPGYKEQTYGKFQELFNDYYKTTGITMIDLASAINIKSIGTIQNAFAPIKQLASDEVITKAMEFIGFDGFIVWKNGERKYFIKSK